MDWRRRSTQRLLVTASLALLAAIGAFDPLASAEAQEGIPAAPTDLVLVPFADASSIELRWNDNAADETAYIVERSNVGSGGPWDEVATPPADSTTYIDSDLESGTTYWYRVAAVNEAGSSPYSNVASATASFPFPTPGETVATPTMQLPPTGRGDPPREGHSIGWLLVALGAAGLAVLLASALPLRLHRR